MRLTRIALEGVGRFGTPARIEGLSTGVNILAAANEAGKSTLFRAIRTCLFERHASKNAGVLALATEGLSLPATITLGFEEGGKSYEITKSFVRSVSASLRCDGTEIARNRDADEKLWEILGIPQGAGRSVDEAAYGILWVSQGQSFKVPEPSEGAASALNAAIQQEVGTLVGGERARQLLASLKAEISKQSTDSGKPRAGGALFEAARAAETAAAELQSVEARLKALDESLDELAKLREDRKRLAAPALTAQLKSELEDAEKHLRAGQESATLLERCQSEERQAHALLKAKDTEVETLRAIARRIDDNTRRCETLAQELKPFDAEEAATRKAVAAAYDDNRRIDAELAALDLEDQQLLRMESLRIRSAAEATQRARLDALRDYEKRLTQTEAALVANTVEAAAVEALDQIERAMAEAQARLEAGAASVSIERLGVAGITINGDDVADKALRSVTEPLVIRIDDRVAITVSPPRETYAAAQKQAETHRQKLRDLLSHYGAASPAALRQARQERIAHEDTLRTLKAERTVLGLKDRPATEIARLTADLQQTGAELGRFLAEVGIDTLSPADEIKARHAGVRVERDRLGTERKRSEGVIEGLNRKLSDLQSTRGALNGQLKEIAAQLQADTAALKGAERHALIAAAEDALQKLAALHRVKALALDAQRLTAPAPDEIERRRNRVSRLKAAIANRDQQVAALNQQIANLEGQVEIAGGDGLGERAAILKAQLEAAEADVARHESRLRSLRLLRDTVEQSYLKRREQLNAPLRRHLKPFLNDVFPQADIELGDGFAISGIRRNGPGSEIFERLSHGTQEQIAVLVRLAMGAMIGERHQQVPVILDDALVFSDDARIEQMFDALNRAGRNQQVIVFTCRARSFASLGGTALRFS